MNLVLNPNQLEILTFHLLNYSFGNKIIFGNMSKIRNFPLVINLSMHLLILRLFLFITRIIDLRSFSSLSLVFTCIHLCSPVFTCVHLCSSVSICVHLCSSVFICVYLCSSVFICVVFQTRSLPRGYQTYGRIEIKLCIVLFKVCKQELECANMFLNFKSSP